MKQITLKDSMFLEGTGVHSGKICKICIKPAASGTGIVFVGENGDAVPAKYENVSGTTMCTRISNKAGTTIAVVEHISAAFYGMGVSNAVVQLTEGDEIPFLDGSALNFVEAIESAGILEQQEEREKLRILKDIKVGDTEKWASFSPLTDEDVAKGSERLIIKVQCDFTARGLHTEPFTYDSAYNDFKKDLSAARTFGFFADVEFLRKNHLALGASLENTLVFREDGSVMNPEGKRYDNEPVRHKILDAMGDLALSGYEIVGKYEAFCPGHGINNALLRKLFENSENYAIG